MMEINPLVSVVMATYNEPVRYIKESIESILKQTYSNLELIIVDDSTNKDTIEAIDSYLLDFRVILIRKPQRMGFVPALNEGLRAAKGEFIARMDGDDISLPDRIQKQIDYFYLHPLCDVLGGNINIIDDANKIISKRQYKSSARDIKLMFLFRSPFAHPTVMLKRDFIDKGIFYNSKYKKAEDIDLWLRLYNNGYRFFNINEPLLNYRVIPNMGNKRSKQQWIFNNKARSENISLQHPIFSLLSILISSIYICIPTFIINIYYNKENHG